MDITKIDSRVSISPQITSKEMKDIANQGFQTIICNRPDGEADGQPSHNELEAAAQEAGLDFFYVPVVPGNLTAEAVDGLANILDTSTGPVLAFCRTGTRSSKLYELTSKKNVQVASKNNYQNSYNVVIVGGGAAGIATAASMLKRNRKISIAIIEPSSDHYYQPGWTMVGCGIFSREFTHRQEKRLIPSGAEWVQSSVATFEPEGNSVTLSDGKQISYDILIVCPGIKLDWDAISGLPETLGKNGVTSNYGYELAPYTNHLVKEMTSGRAIFSQPPMPIKCAGAPQKAMYLSCNHWERAGTLSEIDVQFHTAGDMLFGVEAYVPGLMEYVERYSANLNYSSNLVAIDSKKKVATFEQKDGDTTKHVEQEFDMIHVVPPQCAPDFIRSSPLAVESRFVDVDQATLQHNKYSNIYALGDAASTCNAKTMAAVRKQAPVVAVNALASLEGRDPVADYDGYGSCPLTVERGKIILAEFGYDGKLLPSFPKWLIDGTRPSRLSWMLKDSILPPFYWHGMLKGREWMAKPHRISSD